jgi:hypothetical protein
MAFIVPPTCKGVTMPDITSFDNIGAGPRTAAQLQALIEKVDLAIYNLLNSADKDAGVDYRIGDRWVDRAGYLEWLLATRRTYERQLSGLPAWETTVYDDPSI